jgi:FPC/CPF motif-containing protein YcgG
VSQKTLDLEKQLEEVRERQRKRKEAFQEKIKKDQDSLYSCEPSEKEKKGCYVWCADDCPQQTKKPK